MSQPKLTLKATKIGTPTPKLIGDIGHSMSQAYALADGPWPRCWFGEWDAWREMPHPQRSPFDLRLFNVPAENA